MGAVPNTDLEKYAQPLTPPADDPGNKEAPKQPEPDPALAPKPQGPPNPESGTTTPAQQPAPEKK